MSDLPHIIVVGRFSAALTDWCDRIRSLDRKTLRGTDVFGRPIYFVSVDRPDRLRGCVAQSWELSSCATHFGRSHELAEVRAIMEHRGVPYKTAVLDDLERSPDG